VGLLKWLGTFAREAVPNGAAKCAPVDHSALTSSFSGSGREGKLTYLALPPRGSLLVLSYVTPQMPLRTYADLRRHEMKAYIPRWRGEAKVIVAASKVCGAITCGLCLFVFEGNGGKLEPELGKGHEQDHEQMVLHLNHTLPALNSSIY